jgi:hypothetical protein
VSVSEVSLSSSPMSSHSNILLPSPTLQALPQVLNGPIDLDDLYSVERPSPKPEPKRLSQWFKRMRRAILFL